MISIARRPGLRLPVTFTAMKRFACADSSPRKPGKRPVSHRAFTLVEMLVVISIIAVLAALLFPVVGMMQKKGYQSACISNLRQVLTAANLAANDNDGRFPNMHGYSWEPGDVWIAQTLNPYLGGAAGNNPVKVLLCPAAQKNKSSKLPQGSQFADYRFNIWHGQSQRPQAASNAMLFFDATWADWDPTDFSHSPGGGAFLEVGYADGHVASLTYLQYKQLNPSSDDSAGGEGQNDFFTVGWIK